MKSITYAIVSALLLVGIGWAAEIGIRPLHRTESYYQDKIHKIVGGQREVITDDGTRIDILTDKYAIEVDFAHKWYEGVGQASHYAVKTGKLPMVYLIIEDPLNDAKYYNRCRAVCERLMIYVDGKWLPFSVQYITNK